MASKFFEVDDNFLLRPAEVESSVSMTRLVIKEERVAAQVPPEQIPKMTVIVGYATRKAM
jgi:hypothetical protein